MKRALLSVVIVASLSAPFVGCSSDAEQERLTQNRIRQARQEGARIARQGEQIRELRRDLRRAIRAGRGTVPPSAGDSSGGSSTEPSAQGTTGAESWPVGTAAWTVVLASTTVRSEAIAAASRANAAGLQQVGVLLSDNHSSLRRGYWVAYTGVLDQSSARNRQAEARAAGFADAYARWVSAG